MSKSDISIFVGKQIKFLRNAKNMKQSDLAEILKVVPSSISRYERGELDISLDMILELSKTFNVSINSLFGLPDNLNKQNKWDNLNIHKYNDYIEIIEDHISKGLTPEVLNILVNLWSDLDKIKAGE